ncbi:MAG: Ezrin/radixin/moesin family protein [Cytophagaceae bacterium]
MKRLFLLSILAIAVSANFSMAQKKTKEEVEQEKEWAKKLKELKPLEYKKLVEQKDALAGQISECENSKSSIKSESESKDAEIARLKKEVEDYKTGVVKVPGQATTTTVETDNNNTTKVNTHKGPTKGVVYKVQIGSFKTKDLTKYFDNNPNFSGETDADGSKKYTLGVFTDYWEADKFKKALRDMGVKGAWVVPYKDGQRVNLKDVLEGAM